MNLKNITSHFDIEGEVKTAFPFGNGHINETFRIVNHEDAKPDYLLQRINDEIFTDVTALMENIRKVTEHVNKKKVGATLQLIPTKTGAAFYQDEKQRYWRLYVFRKDLVSYDVATTTEQIYEGARAFGRFLYQLSDFPVTGLHDPLPNFHNVLTRLAALRQAVEKNRHQRVGIADQEITYAFSIADKMAIIQKAGQQGKIPWRATHNDTKFNNVLLDKTGKGVCVIDLETVMPGFVHFDFGDGIRTTVTTVDEDEADISKIQVDLERFKAFTRGYLSVVRPILTPIEIEYLPQSGALFAYLMGIRFLTDFIEGDVYYKTHFKGQNLQRAKAQLTLVKRLIERQRDLERIVHRG